MEKVFMVFGSCCVDAADICSTIQNVPKLSSHLILIMVNACFNIFDGVLMHN